MKWRSILSMTFIPGLACAVSRATQTAASSTQHEPANPHASPEARALRNYLYCFPGHLTLAGQHNCPNTISYWTARSYDLTGKYPALFRQDFGFAGGDDKDSTEASPAMKPLRLSSRQTGQAERSSSRCESGF